MTMLRWERLTREELASAAPAAVTVLPVAAIEQHGPHLATATDTLLVSEIARRACEATGEDTLALLAPTQCYGASDHHLAFGATLSLSTATLRALLGDLLRSAAAAGCERVLLLNGHGGNAATCQVAAADAARELAITVATASYWELIEPPGDLPFPGHAGAFETSLMLAVDADLVREEAARPSPAPRVPRARGLHVAEAGLWQRIDGFTDDPRAADAGAGARLLETIVAAGAAAIAAV
jgi:creatinine amidohydrolase